MNTIKLSEINNFQNYILNKSGDCASVERILFEMVTKLKGRKPTWYYKGKKVIIDTKKENIEEINYCDSCGYQDILDEDSEECPSCGNSHGWFWGHRIKGTQHQLYSDEDWCRLNDEFKKKYIHLKRFDYLRNTDD